MINYLIYRSNLPAVANKVVRWREISNQTGQTIIIETTNVSTSTASTTPDGEREGEVGDRTKMLGHRRVSTTVVVAVVILIVNIEQNFYTHTRANWIIPCVCVCVFN